MMKVNLYKQNPVSWDFLENSTPFHLWGPKPQQPHRLVCMRVCVSIDEAASDCAMSVARTCRLHPLPSVGPQASPSSSPGVCMSVLALTRPRAIVPSLAQGHAGPDSRT